MISCFTLRKKSRTGLSGVAIYLLQEMTVFVIRRKNTYKDLARVLRSAPTH